MPRRNIVTDEKTEAHIAAIIKLDGTNASELIRRSISGMAYRRLPLKTWERIEKDSNKGRR